MHKFYISEIFTKKELEDIGNETGISYGMDYAVRMISDSNVCYFPIPRVIHTVLNKIFEDESGDYVIGAQELSLHRTMLDSIVGSEKELAGVILDLNYDSKVLSDKGVPDFDLSVNLTIVDLQSGKIDSIVDCDFSNSLILALMTGSFVFFTQNLHNFFFENALTKSEDGYLDGGEVIKSLPSDEEIRQTALNILKKTKEKNIKKDITDEVSKNSIKTIKNRKKKTDDPQNGKESEK